MNRPTDPVRPGPSPASRDTSARTARSNPEGRRVVPLPATGSTALERREAAIAPRGGGEPPDPRSDDTGSLVARARSGDLGAFEALYRRHVGRTYALALRMTGDVREAEKATQDVWVRVWEKLDSFRAESSFTTWLHRVARNRILDHLRRRQRRNERAVSLDDAGLLPRSVDPELVEDRLDLERAVAALPEGARTMFVLREIEGLKYREVAEATGTAVGTVKAQVHRARKLLRETLTP